jgi:hypothetical protein
MKRLLRIYLYASLIFVAECILIIIEMHIEGVPIHPKFDPESVTSILGLVFFGATLYYVFDSMRLLMKKSKIDVEEYKRRKDISQKEQPNKQ